MADLIAQGPDLTQRWRRSLPQDKPVVVGREAGVWSVPWDEHVSRQHVRVRWDGQRLCVQHLPAARNPVFVAGRAETDVQIAPGEHFVIGKTTFTLSGDRAQVTLDARQPSGEQVFSQVDLERLAFRDAGKRIELLSRLPHVIEGAVTDGELFVRLVNLLLLGVPRADAAALVEGDCDDAGASVRILHWDRRRLAGGDFQPSQRLIARALQRREAVLHTWTADSPVNEFTGAENIDWAFCTPLRGDACRGWALYLAGRFNVQTPAESGRGEVGDLRDDMKFTELAAATLSSLRELRRLERQQAGLAQFFSPVVMEAVAGNDPQDVLAPRETEVSVLFCDLRGFSRTSERGAADLFGLLERVSNALGVMTREILQHGGVVGDFQGDAAMGFWGWPLPDPDAPQHAALAALAIRSQFEAAAREPGNPLAGFRVGIGVATGRAVAGRIGTADQVKVTVFGPVVNVAARLESLTRHVRAPILLDGATAARLRERMSPQVGRVRRVAVVRPYGFDAAVEMSELAPSAQELPQLGDEDLRNYEAALDEFLTGRWPRAAELLQRVPDEDYAKAFLAAFMAQHDLTAPADWDGVMQMESK